MTRYKIKFDDNYKDDIFDKYCNKYPKLPHILGERKRIICIGDLHGDFNLTIKCLKDVAKVIDDNYNWIAKPKDTIVVQIGDQIDRCRPTSVLKCSEKEATNDDEASDIKILEFFSFIHNKALKCNGGVYSLLGNHEILNVIGNMNYVSYLNIKEFENMKNPKTGLKFNSALEARKYFFKKGNKYAKFLACTRQSALIIGSNLFIHAGLVPKLANKYQIQDINIIIRKWLLDLISGSEKIDGIGNINDILLNVEISPFWPRILGNIPKNLSINDDRCIEYFKKPLQLYNCNNMIIGHTPQGYKNDDDEGINISCINNNYSKKELIDNNVKKYEYSNNINGVWRIDTGSSKGFEYFKNNKIKNNTKPQVLEILNDNQFNVLKLNI